MRRNVNANSAECERYSTRRNFNTNKSQRRVSCFVLLFRSVPFLPKRQNRVRDERSWSQRVEHARDRDRDSDLGRVHEITRIFRTPRYIVLLKGARTDCSRRRELVGLYIACRRKRNPTNGAGPPLDDASGVRESSVTSLENSNGGFRDSPCRASRASMDFLVTCSRFFFFCCLRDLKDLLKSPSWSDIELCVGIWMANFLLSLNHWKIVTKRILKTVFIYYLKFSEFEQQNLTRSNFSLILTT